MSSSVLRILAALLAIGAVTVGYIGYRISTQPPVATKTVQVEEEVPKGEPVLVTARDIPAGHIVSEIDLTTEFVPKRPVHSYSTSSEIIGRQVKIDVPAGKTILSNYFPSYSQLAQNLQPRERAMAVRVDEVIGTGGFIEPGDHVDVLFYLHSGQEVGKNSSAQVLLSNVRVLAFGNQLESEDEQVVHDAEKNEQKESLSGRGASAVKSMNNEKPSGKKSKTAVLAIEESKTSMLLLAETSGKLRLAIHGPDAEKSVSNSLTGEVKQQIGLTSISHTPERKDNTHYVLLKELIKHNEASRKVTNSHKQARVIVHKGHLIETQTLRR